MQADLDISASIGYSGRILNEGQHRDRLGCGPVSSMALSPI